MAKLTKEQLELALKKFLPEKALPHCMEWITDNNIQLRVSKSRHSKYGDYRPPQNGYGHRISVNGDLNQYAFLITFAHEVAHLHQWNHYKRIYEPHGKLWKQEFQKILSPLIHYNIFPQEVVTALQSYLKNPAATSCTDISLLKALKKYDLKQEEEWPTLEEIQEGVTFIIRSGRKFIKKQKLRKNIQCVEIGKRGIYLLSPMMEVKVI